MTSFTQIKNIEQLVNVTNPRNKVVHCINQNLCLYFDEEQNVYEVAKFYVITMDEFNTCEKDLEALYIIDEVVYVYNGNLIKCLDSNMVLNNDFSMFHRNTILTDFNGMDIHPITLSLDVFNSDSTSLEIFMNNLAEKLFAKTKTKYNIVQAVQDNQTTFKIPYPFLDYLLGYNCMTVIINGMPLTEGYTVNGDYLILDNLSLNIGEFVLFVFSYTELIDENNMIINPRNIPFGSITNNHLSSDIKYSADVIVTTPEKRFISDAKIKEFEEKASKDLVTEERDGLFSWQEYKKFLAMKQDIVKLKEQVPTIISGVTHINKGEKYVSIYDEHISKEDVMIVNPITNDDGTYYEGNIRFECLDGSFFIAMESTVKFDVYFKYKIIKN